jgi:hypothetical protein
VSEVETQRVSRIRRPNSVVPKFLVKKGYFVIIRGFPGTWITLGL